MSGKYVINVQILRFFAALSVVFAHVGIEVTDVAHRSQQSFSMVTLFDWGLGVDIFFVISGFIMYYLMHERFAQPGASADFLRRRLIRIVPLYWICTTLMLASILAAGSMINNNGLDVAHIVASYAFFPWPRADGQIFPLLSLGWTLNYEMLFYAVFAVALGWSRRAGLTAMVIFFCVLMVAAALAPANIWLLKFWGDSIIGEFLLGIGLAALFISGRRIALPLAACLVVAGLLLAIVFFQTQTYEHIGRLFTGGIPAIMIAAAVVLGPNAGSSRLARAMAIGGDASYALYLTHPFTIKIFAAIGARLGMPLGLVFTLGIVATVAVAVLVHFWVERPIGAWLSRRLRRVEAKQTPT